MISLYQLKRILDYYYDEYRKLKKTEVTSSEQELAELLKTEFQPHHVAIDARLQKGLDAGLKSKYGSKISPVSCELVSSSANENEEKVVIHFDDLDQDIVADVEFVKAKDSTHVEIAGDVPKELEEILNKFLIFNYGYILEIMRTERKFYGQFTKEVVTVGMYDFIFENKDGNITLGVELNKYATPENIKLLTEYGLFPVKDHEQMLSFLTYVDVEDLPEGLRKTYENLTGTNDVTKSRK